MTHSIILPRRAIWTPWDAPRPWIATMYGVRNRRSASKRVPADWYDTTYKSRVKITSDNTKVAEAVGNLYLDLSLLPAAAFSNMRTDGGDIRVCQSDGITPVNRGIVAIDTIAKTGEMHLKATGLSTSVDTDFFIYFNAPAVTEPSAADATHGSQGVWDTNYKMVQHLPDGTTLSANDSTSNANNGTITGTTAIAGQIDGAGSFASASSQYINVGSNSSLNPSSITISAWIKATSFPNAYNAVIGRENAAANGFYMMSVKSNGKLAFYVYANASVNFDGTGATTLSAGTWYYLTLVYDSVNGLKGYINDSLENSVAANGAIAAITDTTFIGAHRPATYTRYFNGIIDEARISSIARSANYISTQYNCQNSNSTFWKTIGAVENI